MEISGLQFTPVKTLYAPGGNVRVEVVNIIGWEGEYVAKTLSFSKDKLPEARKEVEAMRNLAHRRIVELKGWQFRENDDDIELVLIMEYYEKKSLKDEIKRRVNKSLPWAEDELLGHIRDLVEVFAFIEEKKYAHRDIKPENILLANDGSFHVADLGTAKTAINKITPELPVGHTIAGTANYLSPLLRDAYACWLNKGTRIRLEHDLYKSDVYSLGLTLLVIARLSEFGGLGQMVGFDECVQEQLEQLRFDSVREILKYMLKYNEAERPNFSTLRDLLVGENILNSLPRQSTLGKKSFKRPVDHLSAVLQQGKSHIAADLVRNMVENNEPLNLLLNAESGMNEYITTRTLAEIKLLRGKRTLCIECNKPGPDIIVNCCQVMLLHLKCLNIEAAPPILECGFCSHVNYPCATCKEYFYPIDKLVCAHYLCSKCKTRTCPICPRLDLPEFPMYLLFSVCPNIECSSYNQGKGCTEFKCQTCSNSYCPCCKEVRHSGNCMSICKQGELKCLVCKNTGQWTTQSMFYTCSKCPARCRVCYNDTGTDHSRCECWFWVDK